MQSERYFAHSGKRADGSDWQPLAEHLRNVARLARRFALEARPGDRAFARAAYVAGWLHDLGKYRFEFQQMIRNERGRGETTRHKEAGAARAAAIRRPDLVFAILGHHGGLPDRCDVPDSVERGKQVLESLWQRAVAECPEADAPLDEWGKGIEPLSVDLHIRLLFSCLVDADWLDTSAHQATCEGWSEREEPAPLNAEELAARVAGYIATKAEQCRERRIADIRREVLEAAIAAAGLPPGLFSMTVPTGGGKTLSSLMFALEHARRAGLRRIIYVAPYLSIIEQNARVYREAMGEGSDELVLEHHSLTDPGRAEDDDQARSDAQRLAENWDAPVVLTTSVQFYETLFSNKPGPCRKLHNIARSVVILDECQTLPKGLTAPTCQMLQQASQYLGCSIVLCTATQPAWGRDERLLPEGLEDVHEIVPPELTLFERLKRTRVSWPEPEAAPMHWREVAARMLEARQALCVVNSKRAARELYLALREAHSPSVFHLSTAMCPAHRLEVLERVRSLLAEGAACHVVSTQLVEAGVDLDFPLLFREIAPLESIVQAAGRCNREGLLPAGEVIVFASSDGTMPPDAWYRNGRAIVEQDFLRRGQEPDIHQPADLAEYFRRLYPSGRLDEKNIVAGRRGFCFKTVGCAYQLIDEATTPVVVAGWERTRDEVEALLLELKARPSRRTYRRLQRHTVNLYAHEVREAAGAVVLDHLPGVNLCGLPYDNALGLVLCPPGAVVV